MSRLLRLPSEIRRAIWAQAFGGLDVSPEQPYIDTSLFHCRPCRAATTATATDDDDDSVPPAAAVELYSDCLRSLLTCKQIWDEAGSVFFATMNVHLADHVTIKHIVGRAARREDTARLLHKIRTLTLLVHMDRSNRESWKAALTGLLGRCSSLRMVNIYYHMRPPLNGYTLPPLNGLELDDAIYFAAPLAEASLNVLPQQQRQQQQQQQQQPDDNASLRLRFSYTHEYAVFSLRFNDDISCSEALEEHSALIRHLIQDPAFERAVREHDSDTMKARLAAVTAIYKQLWIDRMFDRVASKWAAAQGWA